MALNLWLVYKINIPSGHSYIGMTDCLYVRMLGHASKIRKGKLGKISVPSTDNISVEIMAKDLEWSEAYKSEGLFIKIDKEENALNCNTQVFRLPRVRIK